MRLLPLGRCACEELETSLAAQRRVATRAQIFLDRQGSFRCHHRFRRALASSLRRDSESGQSLRLGSLADLPFRLAQITTTMLGVKTENPKSFTFQTLML